MDWIERAAYWLFSTFKDPIVIVCGSTALAIILVVAVLWAESRIRNRKDD